MSWTRIALHRDKHNHLCHAWRTHAERPAGGRAVRFKIYSVFPNSGAPSAASAVEAASTASPTASESAPTKASAV